MYKDVGNKIKLLGKIVGWVLLIVGCIVWLSLISNGEKVTYGLYYTYSEFELNKADDAWGWVALVTGVLGFVASWIVYGFGQIVDDIHAMREKQVDSPKEEEAKAKQV